MKTLFRSLLVLFAVLLAIGFASSCSRSDASDDLANIQKAGVLKVGMECAYAPYNWSQTTESDTTVKIQDNMYADGYDVQIARRIADALGVTLEIKPIEWEGLIPALTSGQIDMVIAGMSPTDDRKLSIDLSDTYFDSNLVIVVKKDSSFAAATSLSDFSGAKITGQQNTFHYAVIDQIAGVSKQTALPDFAALIQALDSGSIDGYVCEKPGAVSAVAANEAFTFVEFAEGNGFTCDPAESSIAVGIRKNSSLTAEINKVLATLSTADKEAMMDAAIARQPVSEDE